MPARADALDPSKTLSQYVRRIWQVQQGLPQASIDALLQTRDGYLWLGTQTGLVKFDGVRFTTIDEVDGLVDEGHPRHAICSKGTTARCGSAPARQA